MSVDEIDGRAKAGDRYGGHGEILGKGEPEEVRGESDGGTGREREREREVLNARFLRFASGPVLSRLFS